MSTIKTLEDSLRGDWVVPVSGLSGDRVFFEHQKYKRPATGAYVTILFVSLTPRGVDAVVNEFDPDAAAGEEILQTVVGRRMLLARVQVWQAPTTSRDDNVPSAMELASKLNTGLGRPSVIRKLNRAVIGVLDIGGIRNLSTALGADFDGRAAFDVRMYVKMLDSERTTFIETTSVIVTIDNEDVAFDAVDLDP